MKSVLASLIKLFLKSFYRLNIPTYNGTYFLSPKPDYISQFIGIYPSEITIQTPLTNKHHITTFGARDSEEFTFWAWRDCGIACVKMILDLEGKTENLTIMDLTREGIDLKGYILYENGIFVDKGWFHQSLAKLLDNHGVVARVKRWQTIESVASDIMKNKKVILSVRVPGRSHIKEDGSFLPKDDSRSSGHLILVTGVKMARKKVLGIYAHDPRGLERYQKDTYITTNEFGRIFSGRTIVAD